MVILLVWKCVAAPYHDAVEELIVTQTSVRHTARLAQVVVGLWTFGEEVDI